MKHVFSIVPALLMALTNQAAALSIAPEEFLASRQMACVLAQQSLGQLNEDEYGARTHTVLEGFDEEEQDIILSKALGYYDGLMFSIADDDAEAVNLRLEDFVASNTCNTGFRKVTVSL